LTSSTNSNSDRNEYQGYLLV